MSETPPKHRAQPASHAKPKAGGSRSSSTVPSTGAGGTSAGGTGAGDKGAVPTGSGAKVPPAGAGPAKAVKRPSAKPKRRWPRRALIGVNAVVFICLAAMGSAYGYVRYRLDQIDTGSGKYLIGEGTGVDGGRTSGADDAHGLKPENILLIGNETRRGLTPKEQAYLGASAIYSGSLADIMMVLHLDPAKHDASILSIPRDLFTPMPNGSPVGPYQKLDAALNDGDLGPNNLAEAVEQDFGIPINHYIELNFNGFINSVNALGGIDVYFPERVYDAESLLYVTEPGCHHLNGQTALSLVRARHLQYDPPGDDEPNYDWPQEAQSDLARIVRTHTFIKLVAARARHEYANPIAINNFVGDVLDQMTIDPNLRGELPRLVANYIHLDLATVPELTLPTTGVSGAYYYGNYDIGDVVFPVEPDDEDVIKSWDTSAVPAPAKPTSVQVVSITGDYDAAVAAGQDLASEGLKVSSETTGEVPASTSETLVMYHHKSLAQALDVMKYLSGAVMLQQSSSVAPGTVVVDLGSTVAIKSRPTPATTTTGTGTVTTVPGATTLPATTVPATTLPATTTSPSSTSAPHPKKPVPTTTTVPTPSGAPIGSAKDVQEPWDPRSCPVGSKVLNGA